MEKEKGSNQLFGKFFWILFITVSVLWLLLVTISEFGEENPTPIDEFIGLNIILLSVWFTLCVIISFIINIIKKIMKKQHKNNQILNNEDNKEIIEKNIKANLDISEEKITIKEKNNKKQDTNNDNYVAANENKKQKSNSKPLFTCDSTINAEEYGKMAKYFPRFYWYFVIVGAGVNLLITAVIAIISRKLIISLIFFVAYQIYLMILYKVKLEYYAKKIFNPKNMESEIHSEFYDDYFIRQGEVETLKIYYSDITRCIETDTNIYLEFKKRNKVIFIQKDRCELQLIQFIAVNCG